jgi:hypothetical protein
MKTQALLESVGNFNFPSPSLSESSLVAVSNKIRNHFGYDDISEPKRYSIEEVCRKLFAIRNGTLTFNTLSRKENRIAPWAIFSIYNHEQLFDDREFLGKYLQYLTEQKSFQSLSNWLHVFLLYYPVSIASFEVLRKQLTLFLGRASDNKSTHLKLWVEEYSLLDVEATKKFGLFCLNVGVKAAFEKYKLNNSLASGRFAVAGLNQLLTILSSTFAHNDPSKQKFILDSLFSQIIKDNDLIYPTLRADLADGLLQSFSGRVASTVIKKRLKDFFITFYGDIRTEKVKWIGVSEEAHKVMKQWMVENTLNDFFSLLTHVARYDSMADKHWEYRKRFWNAYLKKGVISEAWVALGPTAYYEAKHFLKGDKNVYASLSGAQSRHSSLIMIIDGVLVTEWSHSGRYRVWDSEYNRPRLYKKSYHRDELVSGSDYAGSHMGSETGGWQYTLSSLINDLTGIKVTNREYMYD